MKKMENYRYHKEGEDECRQNLYKKTCAECLFENLCRFEQNQERINKKKKEKKE